MGRSGTKKKGVTTLTIAKIKNPVKPSKKLLRGSER
jgi:hypothetical protein